MTTTTAAAAPSLKELMAQKRHQMKVTRSTAENNPDLAISIITPEQHRAHLEQQQQAAAAAAAQQLEDEATAVEQLKKGKRKGSVLRKAKPMVFQLVPLAPSNRPSAHNPQPAIRPTKPPVVTSAATVTTAQSKVKRVNKENAAAPSHSNTAASTTLRFLRHHLSSLSLPLLQSEVSHIHALATRPFPVQPSLYFTSPALSLLLQWLQTIALTQSASHSSPPYLVNNFTTALTDGVVLLLLLHYYTDAVQWDEIVWHGRVRVVGGKKVEKEEEKEEEEEERVREEGWVGAFSFRELSRREETEEERATRMNWSRLRAVVPRVAPSVEWVEGMERGSGEERVEESRVLIFLCQLSSALLQRSRQVHAARRIQRWWRHTLQRRSLHLALHQLLSQPHLLTPTTHSHSTEQVEVEAEVEEEVEVEDEVWPVAPPPTPATVARCEVRAQLWADGSSLMMARQRAEEMRKEVEREEAAVEVQRRWRGKMGRRQAMARRRQVQEVEEETRREEQRKLEQLRQGAAAQLIQSVWRGWKVRRDVAQLLQVKAEVEAEMRLKAQMMKAERKAERQRACLVVGSFTASHVVRVAERKEQEARERRETEEAKRKVAYEAECKRTREAAEARDREEQEERGRKEEADRRAKHEAEERTRRVAAVKRVKEAAEQRVRDEEERENERRRKAEIKRQAKAEAEQFQLKQEAERLIKEAAARRAKEEYAQRQLIERQRQEEVRRAEEEEHRRWLVEVEVKRREAAACVVQRAWRNWRKTTQVVEELRGEIYAARLESAVIAMQARTRGNRARKEVMRLREERAKEEKKKEERQRLLHRVQSLNATLIQTQVRVFLSKRLLAVKQAERRRLVEEEKEEEAVRCHRSAVVIQALWRGHRQRVLTPQLIDRRHLLKKLQLTSSPARSMEGRTVAALSVLSSSQSLTAITRAVQTLSVTSQLRCICESLLLPALPALFSLIRSCNRSQPHLQLLLLCLTTLTHLASHPTTRRHLYQQPSSAAVLCEQLQVYRDQGRVMRRVVGLLEVGKGVEGWVEGMREEGVGEEGGGVMRRVEVVCELLEKKCKSERRLGRAWWGSEERVQHIREMDDIAKRLRYFIDVPRS